jgi:hypothetical protein
MNESPAPRPSAAYVVPRTAAHRPFGRPLGCEFSHFKKSDGDGKLSLTMRDAQMHATQIIPGSIFGAAYVLSAMPMKPVLTGRVMPTAIRWKSRFDATL